MGGGFTSIRAASLSGTEANLVYVEVSISAGIPGLDIIGMPDAAVLESRSRVRCAIRSSGFSLPRAHMTVNLAPGGTRKSGTAFDLPIAVALLVATNQLPGRQFDNLLLVGELALDGTVCPVRGDVAYATLARDERLTLVTSAESPLSGSWAGDVLGIDELRQLKGGVEGLQPPTGSVASREEREETSDVDYLDVVDQELAKRAMTVAAAGGHGMLMIGPPGAGKTMLARRLPTILPPLDDEEADEAMLVHSVAGQPIDSLALGRRPFRAPHHSISTGGLIGGGKPVLPGEISLAHRGVLFLDELPEFARTSLQALRQPLEDHVVRIRRVEGNFTFPCNFQLVAAANPCPCGHLGDPGHECVCAAARIVAYQSRIGGPIMDRIDVVVDVPRPNASKVIAGEGGLSSSDMADSVQAAREFRSWREGKRGPRGGPGWLEPEARRTFEELAEGLGLGGRAIVRVTRVARTIADLAQRERISEDDIVEALGFRSRSAE